jgi:hypothetical protein
MKKRYSNKEIRFIKSVKWRVERDNILLCNRKNAEFFNLPIEYECFLTGISEGVNECMIPLELKEDLIKAQLVITLANK